MTEQRRLAAIVSADVAGYSRLMGRDESGTLAALKALRREVVDPRIAKHNGRIVKTTGDGLLLEFASVVDAVRCVIEVQTAMARKTAEVPEDRRIAFRVGVNIGDIIIDADDIFGDGVNVAARLQEIAPPGGVCISDRAHDDVRDRLDTSFADMGAQTLKNIARPIPVWRWSPDGLPGVSAAPAVLALPDKPSIAVLPFQNMSGDPEQEYFADGVVEDIITALSRFKSLFVIARNSSFSYKGKSPDIRQVGRELGVRYVLEGSVRKAGGRVRITGQLIEAASGAHLWADRFEGALSDIFDMQDKVTTSVVTAIAPRIEQAEIERTRRRATHNLDAYDLYLRAVAALNTGPVESKREAAELCDRAITLDPGFASAHALAASAQLDLWAYGQHEGRLPVQAIVALAERALTLDHNDASVAAIAARTLAWGAHDLDTAAYHAERAYALNPNLNTACVISGFVGLWKGNPDRAIEQFQQALRLNPLWVNTPGGIGILGLAHAFLMARRFDEALAASRRAVQFIRNPTTVRTAAASAALAGQHDEASKYMAAVLKLDPSRRISNLGEILGPYQRQQDVELYTQGLRLAGLPE